jgi:hypothetical protein
VRWRSKGLDKLSESSLEMEGKRIEDVMLTYNLLFPPYLFPIWTMAPSLTLLRSHTCEDFCARVRPSLYSSPILSPDLPTAELSLNTWLLRSSMDSFAASPRFNDRSADLRTVQHEPSGHGNGLMLPLLKYDISRRC